MSLLLDARKKAELAMNQTGVHKPIEPQLSEALLHESRHASDAQPDSQSADNTGATQSPRNSAPVTASAKGGAPSSASRPTEGRVSGGASFTEVRDDPVAAPARSTPTGAPPLRDDSVAAGKNLFAAKSRAARKGRGLGIIPIVLIGGAVIAAGGGYYVWREIQPPPQALRQLQKPQPPAPIVKAAPPGVPAAATPAPAPLVPVQETAPATPPAQPPGSLAQAPQASRAQAGSAAGKPLPAPRKPRAAPAHKIEAADREASSAPPAPGIRIERGQQQAHAVDPALMAAWQAYNSGDLVAAEKRYGDILKGDARNRDALLGMAAIAQQQGRDDAAIQYYRQVLGLDPRDPIAHAGMLSLLGPGNEAAAESRLKLLLAQQPRSTALHFAMGNLYAEQSRWGDAQQAYFSASNIEPDNAQFAFNLAVSLDHLGRTGPAVQYYRRALQLDGAAAPQGIDRAQTQRRLNELMAGQ